MPSTLHHGELVPPPGALALGNGPSFSPTPENVPVEPSLSLRDFFDILRRRKLVAFNVFVLVVALGVAVTLMTKPVFRTGARLLVEGSNNAISISNGSDPIGGLFRPKPGRDVDTQIEILRSPMVLDRVFKQAGVGKGLVSLDVQRVDRTDVIDLTATSTSREAAERFITALPKVYENDTRNDRLREVTQSLNFARTTLAQQTAKLQTTERALEQLRNNNKVVNTSGETTDALTAVAQARADLDKAKQEVARARAQLAELTRQRASLSRFVDTPVTTTNPLVQVLNEQLAVLNADRAQKLFLYKPTDDEVRKVDLQINILKRRIASTPGSVTNTSRNPNPAIPELDSKVRDARTALDASQKSLSEIGSQVAAQTSNLGRFNTIALKEGRLTRDLVNSTNAYNTLSDKVLQLTLLKTALDAQGAPVTTMQAGGAATQIAPRMSRNLMAALFLGALLACGAALLQESLDDHIRDEEEARRLLGTSVLGYFPTVGTKGERPILNLESPDRTLLETFRVLRSNVQFALVNSPGQKLLVTSSVPGEGKSYIASNLAIAMALAGKTVILVDTDLHKPRQHEIFGVQRYPGLTNVLVGDAKLRDCVQEVGIPGMRLISAGVTPPNPAELLNSAVMDAIIDRLGKGADVVIFDSPPLLATADSQVLSSKVDGVIMVMQLGRVPRSATKRAFELLRQSRANVIGMVFNQVDKKTSDSYGGYGNYYEDYVDDDSDDDDHNGAPHLGSVGRTGVESAGALLTRARRFLHEPATSSNGNSANGHSANGHSSNGSSPNGEFPTKPDANGDNGTV